MAAKIFLSHTAADKHTVEPIAIALSRALGRENVFYDSWSIQPGDGIIDRMNSGLEECDCFFLFLSERSLTSEMVKMEWENTLMAHAKRGMKFVPVLLDGCSVPAIMLQALYIDVARNGRDVAVRQMIDVASGANTYREEDLRPQNLRAYVRPAKDDGAVEIEVRAERMMELVSRYAVLVEGDGVTVSCPSEPICLLGEGDPVTVGDGAVCIPRTVSVERATVGRFPLRIRVEGEPPIGIHGVFRAVGEGEFERVPVVIVMPDDMFHLGADVEIPYDEVCAPGITPPRRAEVDCRGNSEENSGRFYSRMKGPLGHNIMFAEDTTCFYI